MLRGIVRNALVILGGILAAMFWFLLFSPLFPPFDGGMVTPSPFPYLAGVFAVAILLLIVEEPKRKPA